MISAFFAGVWPYLVVAFGSIGVFLAAFFKGKKAGKTEVEHEANEQVVENVKKAKEAENEADNVNDVDSALRDNDWLQ